MKLYCSRSFHRFDHVDVCAANAQEDQKTPQGDHDESDRVHLTQSRHRLPAAPPPSDRNGSCRQGKDQQGTSRAEDASTESLHLFSLLLGSSPSG